MNVFEFQQAKDMVMDLIRDQGFREQRSEYGSRMGGSVGEGLDVSCDVGEFTVTILCVQGLNINIWCAVRSPRFPCRASQWGS